MTRHVVISTSVNTHIYEMLHINLINQSTLEFNQETRKTVKKMFFIFLEEEAQRTGASYIYSIITASF